jgi:2-keto-4-pentenoate hydratase/2-oxohepta-3-ene-1,7-dioic acid hydratase in catechol pathway
MRLVRFGEKDHEKPGLLQNDHVVDLRSLFPDIPDIGYTFFRDGWPEKVRDVGETGEKWNGRLGSPVHNPSKIICLGKNYAEHAQEGGFDKPEQPILFAKTPNTLNGPYDPVILPQSSVQVDWEVELAVVIGKEAKRIPAADVDDYIAGFTVMNDVSAREAQFSDGQWFRGKSFDTFAPLGPALVTKDKLPDVHNLGLTALVDGKVMQEGNTKDMIFDIPYIIEFISKDITLLPGDIISTGTPSGVGIFRDPPILLQAGNVVECRIQQIGSIINEVL